MFNYSRSLDLRHHYSMGHKSYDDKFDGEGKNEEGKTLFSALPTSSPQAC